MIRRVSVRRFKRFDEMVIEMPGHIVLSGPNNTGKTTFLQAISAWSLSLNRWKQLNHYQRYRGAYPKAPITRQAFSAVPLRAFDLLWHERRYLKPIEIEVQSAKGWIISMELIPDSTEQIYVRPTRDTHPDVLHEAELTVLHVPPMTGLSTGEPIYQPPKQDQLLGRGIPGEIIRNLIVQAFESLGWEPLKESIRRLFHCELLSPDATGADILAEYRDLPHGPRLDIASAGSGFHQVLMLLAFLHTRPGTVLLLDQPDAHLHLTLIGQVWKELCSVATEKSSQLVVATNSERIINSIAPGALRVLLDHP
jgi:DNA polymerase III delta prime subunit